MPTLTMQNACLSCVSVQTRYTTVSFDTHGRIRGELGGPKPATSNEDGRTPYARVDRSRTLKAAEAASPVDGSTVV